MTVRTTVAVVVALSTCGALAAPGRHVIGQIPIAGDYGWDYATADTEGRRLYVGHVKEIAVVDLDTGAVVGRVAGGTNMHGVAIAQPFGRGFISQTNPESGSVVIFDLKTLARIGEVTVGKDPNLVLFDRKTGRVFTADRGDARVSAIDARTGRVVGAVGDLGGRTEHGASDEKGHLFLNLQDKGLLLRIDARALKVLDRWPVAPCGQPSAMDMDKEHQRVFIGCRSGVFAAVDGDTGRVITTLPIGPGVDALEFDARTRLIYVSSGGEGGSLSVFRQDSPDHYSLVEKVSTEAGARTLALDHRTGRVYLPVGQVAQVAGGAGGRGAMVPGSFHLLVVGG